MPFWADLQWHLVAFPENAENVNWDHRSPILLEVTLYDKSWCAFEKIQELLTNCGLRGGLKPRQRCLLLDFFLWCYLYPSRYKKRGWWFQLIALCSRRLASHGKRYLNGLHVFISLDNRMKRSAGSLIWFLFVCFQDKKGSRVRVSRHRLHDRRAVGKFEGLLVKRRRLYPRFFM